MTGPKKYSLAPLIDICGGSEEAVKDALPWHELRGDGLWLAPGREACIASGDLATMRWHPRKNSAVPALPVPFTVRDLAAFFLAGGGLFLYERFDFEALDAEVLSTQGRDSDKHVVLSKGYRDALHDAARDAPGLFEDALRRLGDNADEAREALREAIKLRRMADDKFGRGDDDVRNSANWLLNDAHRDSTAPHSDPDNMRAVAADAAHIEVGQDAAAADAPEHEPTTGRTVAHKLRRRADPLAAVIAKAKTEALDSTDWANVWAALVALAQRADRPPPLLGYIEGEGVKYQTDSADTPVGWMTREAWRKRASREA